MNPVWHPPRVILRSFGPRIQSACQVGTSLNRQKVFMHTLHMTFSSELRRIRNCLPVKCHSFTKHGVRAKFGQHTSWRYRAVMTHHCVIINHEAQNRDSCEVVENKTRMQKATHADLCVPWMSFSISSHHQYEIFTPQAVKVHGFMSGSFDFVCTLPRLIQGVLLPLFGSPCRYQVILIKSINSVQCILHIGGGCELLSF